MERSRAFIAFTAGRFMASVTGSATEKGEPKLPFKSFCLINNQPGLSNDARGYGLPYHAGRAGNRAWHDEHGRDEPL